MSVASKPMITLQMHEEYDQNEAFLSAISISDILPESSLFSRPSTPTGEAATALPCASGSQAVVEASAVDTRVLTPEEQDKANINLIVSIYTHERHFLEHHKVKHPNVPLTAARRARIKRDAFVAAEFELSSHAADFEVTGKPKNYKGCREARNVRAYYKATKAERRSLAARLLA